MNVTRITGDMSLFKEALISVAERKHQGYSDTKNNRRKK
jgi:hypothetical protein